MLEIAAVVREGCIKSRRIEFNMLMESWRDY
jgi:hypothetical protein